jgi:hypothetical protein
MRSGVTIFLVLLLNYAFAEAGSANDVNLFAGAAILILGAVLGILYLIDFISKKIKKKEHNPEAAHNPSE